MLVLTEQWGWAMRDPSGWPDDFALEDTTAPIYRNGSDPCLVDVVAALS